MTRDALRALALDILCVMALVVIGTRNHETDTGVSGVLSVAAPFLSALLAMHVVLTVLKKTSMTTAIWLGTVGYGMVLRNLVFDRGTALPFVIVATLFLGATMFGWRALVARRSSSVG